MQQERFRKFNWFCKILGVKPTLQVLQVFLKFEKGGKKNNGIQQQ